MKNIYLIVLLFVSHQLLAQWSGTTNMTTPSNVGIGTTTVGSHKLNIENSVSDFNIRLKNIGDAQEWLIGSTASNWGTGAGKLVFTGTGYSGTAILTLVPLKVGIANVSPRTTLDVGIHSNNVLATSLARMAEGDATGEGTMLGVRTYTTSVNQKAFALEHIFYGNINSALTFYRGGSTTGGFVTFSTNNNTERMRITNGGSVCIGTTVSNGYKLAVEGTIGAREVNINTATWSDYVFDADYKLLPLTEVEKYIAANHHLPEVPSAKEVEANGVNVGEMNALLLKKIEELTLHIIDQEKRINELEKKADH